jgi:3-methyladenine DNA glycosylase/8-oxoguanine DNA glycosylase
MILDLAKAVNEARIDLEQIDACDDQSAINFLTGLRAYPNNP